MYCERCGKKIEIPYRSYHHTCLCFKCFLTSPLWAFNSSSFSNNSQYSTPSKNKSTLFYILVIVIPIVIFVSIYNGISRSENKSASQMSSNNLLTSISGNSYSNADITASSNFSMQSSSSETNYDNQIIPGISKDDVITLLTSKYKFNLGNDEYSTDNQNIFKQFHMGAETPDAVTPYTLKSFDMYGLDKKHISLLGLDYLGESRKEAEEYFCLCVSLRINGFDTLMAQKWVTSAMKSIKNSKTLTTQIGVIELKIHRSDNQYFLSVFNKNYDHKEEFD